MTYTESLSASEQWLDAEAVNGVEARRRAIRTCRLPTVTAEEGILSGGTSEIRLGFVVGVIGILIARLPQRKNCSAAYSAKKSTRDCMS